jgi:iron(III) transport system ATP-binding protein
VANVSIRGLSKRFGGTTPTIAIDEMNLEISPGEFLVLLGPSGCGKTTTLRCIAGLENPDGGEIAFGDRKIYDASTKTNVPTHKRNIGMVFQSYALWPHMTVRKNIGYPLRTKRMDRGKAREWITEIARLVDCENLLDRYPGQLSGGQQQRVALCRGLVARPDLVLFDEPLSNLDARLRDQVRTEIHELHNRLQFTSVYVTHDQAEALALGDRLVIMRAGRIEQLDTPERVFDLPATEYVADFIGMSNRLALERHDSGWTFEGQSVDGRLGSLETAASSVSVRLRPEDVQLAPVDAQAPPDATSFRAVVADAEFGGRHVDVVAEVGGTRLRSRIPAREHGSWARSIVVGQPVLAFFPATALVVAYDADGNIAESHGRRRPTPIQV